MKLTRKLLSGLAALAIMASAAVCPVQAGYDTIQSKDVDFWEFAVGGSTDRGSVQMYTGEKHAGSYSIRTQYQEDVLANNYIRIINSLNATPKVGTKYRVTFWTVTAPDGNGKFQDGNLAFAFAYANNTQLSGNATATGNRGNGFYEYYLDITCGAADPRFMFTLNGKVYTTKFDDFSIYELDANNQPIGNNLIRNGGFESNVDKAVVDEVRTTNAELSANGFKIYQADNGQVSNEFFWGISTSTYCEGNSSVAVRNAAAGTIVLEGKVGAIGGWNTITFKVKGDYNASNIAMRNWKLDGTQSDGYGFSKSDAGNGWTKYKLTYWAGAGQVPLIYVRGESTSIAYFDDICLYAGKEESGVNLYADTGFNYTELVSKVENLKYVGGNLSWEIPDAFDWSEYNIYKNDEFVANIDDYSISTYQVAANAGDILTVYTDTDTTEGVSVTVKSIEVGKVTFDLCDGSGAVTQADIKAITTGKIKATWTLSNFNAGSDYKATVIAALYKGNKLEDVLFTEGTITENGEESSVYTSIDVPEGEGYSIKAMLWNNTGSMKALTGAVDLKAQSN